MATADLGQTLKTHRQARGLTIEAVATAAGVHRTTVSRWERGKAVPFTHELTRVLDALNVGQKERLSLYKRVDAPRAVQVADAGRTAALPISSGEILRALRKRAKVSQRDIARAAAVSQNLVSKWENGECWPSGAQLHAFCFAIGATDDELIFLTTRAWRHMEPLPQDKRALDQVVLDLEYRDTTTTRAGTYLALAARCHALYRAGKISEVEATGVYGSYAYYLAYRLGQYKEAARIVAPVFESIKRSRGLLTYGQKEALRTQIHFGNQLDAGADRSDSKNKTAVLEKNLGLLDGVAHRIRSSYGWYIGLFGAVWVEAGHLEPALPYFQRSIEASGSLRRYARECGHFVGVLCRHGRYREAVPYMVMPSSDEKHPPTWADNLCNHARLFTGLGEFADAERYLSQATDYVHRMGLTNYRHGEEIRYLTHAIEVGRSRKKRKPVAKPV